jgi:hypothetical protein
MTSADGVFNAGLIQSGFRYCCQFALHQMRLYACHAQAVHLGCEK